jgi:ankyrin repeat protein
MDDSHKRNKSKTHLVKSVLHRVHSRQEEHNSLDEEEISNPPSRTSPTTTASVSTISLPNQSPASGSKTQLGSQRSRHRPNVSTSMSSVDGGGPAPPAAPASANGSASKSPANAGPSLDQSVRLFRTFEALRNGDTAGIQKAMRDREALEGTSVLHLAIQCAELPVIEFVLSNLGPAPDGFNGINTTDQDGNTPLHVASKLGRSSIVKLLLEQDGISDAIPNYNGQTAIDVAFSPDIFQQLQLFRSLYVDTTMRRINAICAKNDYASLEALLKEPRVRTTIDVNSGELATDPVTVDAGGTLLHEAARRKDTKLIQILLLNGADPFRRDRKGKLPQDVTKDDRTRAILKKSPAAAEARQGIQEKTIVGSSGAIAPGLSPSEAAAGNKEAREMKGYLKKWTNYTSGWKLRWFVLEEGVLSYYKHQGTYWLRLNG